MSNTKQLFNTRKPLIGMVHVEALPGTPRAKYDMATIIDRALSEARMLEQAGFHAIMIENMHDTPYITPPAGPEIVASMSVVAKHIRTNINLPLGIQVLASANKAALAVALAAGADFIRAEGFVFGHVADEGYIESCAGELLRYRKQIGAEHIAVFTDIKKKHASHAITADIDISETAKASEFFLSDGLIVTGVSTGQMADKNDLQKVKSVTSLPVLVGSGITAENIEEYIPVADGLIIGSSLKHDGAWSNSLDESRLKRMLSAYKDVMLTN